MQSVRGAAREKRNRDPILSISKLSIKKLARRAGCVRLAGEIYEETREVMKVFLRTIVNDAITLTLYGDRRTVTPVEIMIALKKNGKILYGFDEI